MIGKMAAKKAKENFFQEEVRYTGQEIYPEFFVIVDVLSNGWHYNIVNMPKKNDDDWVL